jgi:peptidoglycan hydrolase CwlO-like protein
MKRPPRVGDIKRLQDEIDRLLNENRQLREEIEAHKQARRANELKIERLEAEIERLSRLLGGIK